jgi:molybdate transport system ATP-binding protein
MIKVKAKKKLMTAEGPLDLDIDFKVQEAEFVTLFGESGGGKTTTLRMIAGLTPPDEGYIEVDGKVWFDSTKKIDLPANRRHVGFVFQEYSLFPNMTVRQNLEYALENRRDKGSIDDFLSLVHLSELQDCRPHQLSGGQKQRIALVRALLRKPKVYLLDEPLAAVDLAMRLKLQDEILALYRKAGIATIFVSHDLPEVFKLAGKVLVLEKGRIVKAGTPTDVFVQDRLSGKFKFVGQVVEIRKDDIVNLLTVQIGNSLIKVVATDEEIRDINIGDKIIVASKAFNPIIMKYP